MPVAPLDSSRRRYRAYSGATKDEEGDRVQVRIGIVQSPREIDIDLDDSDDGTALIEQITEAMSGPGMLWLTDKRGRRIGVSAEKVAYVEVGTEAGDHRVGFSAL